MSTSALTNIAARAGVHVGVLEYEFVNRIPSWPSLSKFLRNKSLAQAVLEYPEQ